MRSKIDVNKTVSVKHENKTLQYPFNSKEIFAKHVLLRGIIVLFLAAAPAEN